MRQQKIDKVELSRMLTAGKPQKEIAEYFGVTEGAVSVAKTRLNINVVKTVALEDAHRVVGKTLNTIDQLVDINNKAKMFLEEAVGAKDHETGIKAMREIREQLALQLQIFKTLYDLEAVRDFQTEVLGAIGEVDANTRDRIIQRLKEKSALRGSVTIR